ncbi:MAG: DUF3883 domain-containing protein [Treponema sp.]|nr:DUF3883 domain-containing protein [Treponema sp.]
MNNAIEYIISILYHKIQDSDFTNMYGVKKPKSGGGQTYIQAAGYSNSELDRMFKEAIAVDTPEYWDEEKKHPRKKYTLTAYTAGSEDMGELELAPRTGRKDYRISRQNLKYRHPAWSQKHGFPSPDMDKSGKYVYEKNYPQRIDNLFIMIIKACVSISEKVKYYAAYVDSKNIPEGWPKDVGLESIFSGKKQGIIFYDEQFLRFKNDKINFFSPGSAVDNYLDNVELPDSLTYSTEDAIEYAVKEIDLSLDVASIKFVFVDVPIHKRKTKSNNEKVITKGKNFDRQQRNLKKLGDLGEMLVLEMERRRLVEARREDLAARIVHSSKIMGDGLGYDIQSFELRGKKYVEIFIEVKTTTGGKNKPFDISANEVAVSAVKRDSYYIYRLFGLGSGIKEIKYYKVKGSITERFTLIPTVYKAYAK